LQATETEKSLRTYPGAPPGPGCRFGFFSKHAEEGFLGGLSNIFREVIHWPDTRVLLAGNAGAKTLNYF
jgi:hypothetical protein